jgi:flavin-dependent dehydrogenase
VSELRPRYDVIVVGAGPAGASAAAALAAPSRSVLLVDSDAPGPSYNAFLSAPAVDGLRRLPVGNLPLAPVEGIELVFGARSRRLMPVQAAACDHAALVRALRDSACDAGAEHVRAIARVLDRDEGWSRVALDGVVVSARHLVLATGARRIDRGHALGIGCVQRFTGVALGNRVTLAVVEPDGRDPRERPTCVWAVPAPGGGVSVGAARVGDAIPADPDALIAQAMAELRRTDVRFAGAVSAGPVISGPIDTGFAPERLTAIDGIPVGAAAGLTNPFTGEGLSSAVQSALLAGECITAHPADPDAARTAFARKLRTTFVGYFEAARHGARRYHLTWRVLADAADSDQPFAAKARRAILLPEGIAGLGDQRIVLPDAPLVEPFLLACDEVVLSVVRTQWPFLARLATTGDNHGSQRLRPAHLFLGALLTTSPTPDIRHATTAAAIELATLGALAFLHPPPPRSDTRGIDWAAAATVLCGDFLLAEASRLIAESAPQTSWSFADWLAELAELRTAALDTKNPPQADLVYATLFEFPARIGAILADAPAHVVHAVAGCGHHSGRAFLHAEDVLALGGRRTRLDTTLEAMLAGRFTGLPDTLADQLPTAGAGLRAQLSAVAVASCHEARRRALAPLAAVTAPAATRLLSRFVDAIATPAEDPCGHLQ